MPLSNLTLMKIAAIGGFATAAMGFALRSKLNQRISETEYYQEATQIMQKHPGVNYLLGTPLKVGSIDVSNNEQNWTNKLTAHYEVPIKGSKQKGKFYFWAERKNEQGSWSVSRIELELQGDTSKRLLVKGN